MPFWDVDFPSTVGGGGDTLGEDAVDEEPLLARARNEKGG